jgi:hypothetical protein
VLLLPLWGRRWGPRAWLAFAAVFGLPWLPLLAGGTPFNGLGIFATRGDFNGGLYRLVEEAWYLALASPYARLWARAAIAAGLILVYGVSLVRQGGPAQVLPGWRFAGAFLGLSLLFSPVVHPWYVCWLLAFLAVEGSAAWLVLSVSVIFARHVYIGYEQSGLWQEAWWPALAVWLPLYLALLIQIPSRLPARIVPASRVLLGR